MKLTPKQEDVMRFIQREIVATGHAPTLDAICVEFELASKSRAHAYVTQLVLAGHLARADKKSRGLTILKPIADDRLEHTAREVCRALGIETPDKIKTVRETLYAQLSEQAAA